MIYTLLHFFCQPLKDFLCLQYSESDLKRLGSKNIELERYIIDYNLLIDNKRKEREILESKYFADFQVINYTV